MLQDVEGIHITYRKNLSGHMNCLLNANNGNNEHDGYSKHLLNSQEVNLHSSCISPGSLESQNVWAVSIQLGNLSMTYNL